MIAIRLDRLGRVHWYHFRSGAPDEKGREQLARTIGAEDGDHLIFTYENTPTMNTPPRVEHYIASVPTQIELIKQSDGPIEVQR